jgi:hypothetical protein
VIKTGICTFMTFLCSALLVSWMAALPSASSAPWNDAKSATPETVLIRNVTLLKQEGQAEDVVVNILIRDNRLDMVTQDKIPADTAELALDAQKGVLLGQLNPGQPPSFMILDGDPRDDLQILLGTTTHACDSLSGTVFSRLH